MLGLVIFGPTGVGKTNISIKLAKELDLEIISADSMQIYKEMNIGTSKITHEEMNGIKHYIIDIINPIDNYSVGDFEKDVTKILTDKENKNEDVMLVGGTGLYISSITNGIAELPPKNNEIRKKLESKSLEELANILEKIDIEAYNKIDIKNKIKIVRALEIYELTGEKFSNLKNKNIKRNNYKFIQIYLTRDREELYDRINKRVDDMIAFGLVEEAKHVYEKYNENLQKVQAIGYKELFEYFNKNISLEEAIEKIKQESRRYAKRQITWFNKVNYDYIFNLSDEDEDKVLDNILKIYRKSR